MKITLRRQIEALQEEIDTMKRSYTEAWGSYKGKIRPGPYLRHTEALIAAKKTLEWLHALPK